MANSKVKTIKKSVSKKKSSKIVRKPIPRLRDSEYSDLDVGLDHGARPYINWKRHDLLSKLKEDLIYEKIEDPNALAPDHFDDGANAKLTPNHRNQKLFNKHMHLSKHYHNDHYTPDHERAFEEYAADSRHLNRALYSRDYLSSRQIDHASRLDDALKKRKTPHDMHVYTGVGFSPHKYIKDGQLSPVKIRMRAYTSTSINQKVAQRFSRPDYFDDRSKIPSKDPDEPGQSHYRHVIKIHVPKGSHGAYIAQMGGIATENEFLMHKGSYLHIHPVPTIMHHDNTHYMQWEAKLVHDGVAPTRHLNDKSASRLQKFADRLKANTNDK